MCIFSVSSLGSGWKGHGYFHAQCQLLDSQGEELLSVKRAPAMSGCRLFLILEMSFFLMADKDSAW